ncbi:MAG: hypothetical protein HFJ04_11485 [Lachnospiraceae bacterium]|nr:hypothetical protein [Lachnospiraceae bacterium]
MGFLSDVFEFFLGAMAEVSEECYKRAASSYDDSDPESVERYRAAREVYNQTSGYSEKTRKNSDAMNYRYGNKDSGRSRVEEKIQRERQEKEERDYENMIRNQYK